MESAKTLQETQQHLINHNKCSWNAKCHVFWNVDYCNMYVCLYGGPKGQNTTKFNTQDFTKHDFLENLKTI